MKKIVCVALMVILSANLLAQEKESRIHYGVKMGYVNSRLAPNYTDNFSNKYNYTMLGGIMFGGFIQFASGKNLLFQPELLVVWKGTKHSGFNNYDRAAYFEIPINVLVKLPAKSGFFLLGGGPAPSILISHNYGINNGYAGFDMGVNILMGYQIPTGFSLQLNFTKGFSAVYKQNSQKLTNMALGLSIAYTF